jgi:hypothetical protein
MLYWVCLCAYVNIYFTDQGKMWSYLFLLPESGDQSLWLFLSKFSYLSAYTAKNVCIKCIKCSYGLQAVAVTGLQQQMRVFQFSIICCLFAHLMHLMPVNRIQVWLLNLAYWQSAHLPILAVKQNLAYFCSLWESKWIKRWGYKKWPVQDFWSNCHKASEDFSNQCICLAFDPQVWQPNHRIEYSICIDL